MSKVDNRYMMIALINMVLYRSKIDCELYIDSIGNIKMHDNEENCVYRENGLIIKNEKLISTVSSWLTVGNDDCYPKTDRESTLILKKYINTYLNSNRRRV